MMDRRTVLSSILALLGTAGLDVLPAGATGSGATKPPKPNPVKLGDAVPFSRNALLDKIRKSASKKYVPPRKIPDAWIDLTYDQYKAIQFKHYDGLWHGTDEAFELQFFAPGLYFPTPISISVVEGDKARPVLFDQKHFAISDIVPKLPNDETLGYSGFRINSFIDNPDNKSEFAVFQGASYFRAIGKGQTYGLSARGLAINTADAKGEEFPEFRSFWFEGGKAGSTSVKVHALLDSPSVTGLYTFNITPGDVTQMDVEATLFPREELNNVGLAAETSMFLFDETNRNRFDDFRPAVHDSDGLLIENGAGETLWRALANPTTLQVSSFVDENPRGFGLMQRPQKLDHFADLQANYHKRPGLWVKPGENWGKGSVTLVEIPTDREIYDNIVAYWRPQTPLVKGSEHTFSYRLTWGDKPPTSKPLAIVTNTRMGKRYKGGRIVTIDFEATDNLPEKLEDISLHVSANRGKVSKGILQKNPATGGVRLAFEFFPKDHKSIELRAQLMVGKKSASEVWLYRWTV